MAGAVTGSGFMSRTEREAEYIPAEDTCARGHRQQDARLIAFLPIRLTPSVTLRANQTKRNAASFSKSPVSLNER